MRKRLRAMGTRFASLARRLRARWTDLRTWTLVCYGGPMDGERVWAALREWYGTDGRYSRRGRLFVWEQYAPTRSEAPPLTDFGDPWL